MSQHPPASSSAWATRRRMKAERARSGAAAAVGVLLATVGIALGLVTALTRDGLYGAVIVVMSSLLGILILLVGSLVGASREP